MALLPFPRYLLILSHLTFVILFIIHYSLFRTKKKKFHLKLKLKIISVVHPVAAYGAENETLISLTLRNIMFINTADAEKDSK